MLRRACLVTLSIMLLMFLMVCVADLSTHADRIYIIVVSITAFIGYLLIDSMFYIKKRWILQAIILLFACAAIYLLSSTPTISIFQVVGWYTSYNLIAYI